VGIAAGVSPVIFCTTSYPYLGPFVLYIGRLYCAPSYHRSFVSETVPQHQTDVILGIHDSGIISFKRNI